MNIKCRNLKTVSSVSVVVVVLILLILPVHLLAQTQSKQEPLTLTVRLQDPYNSDFKLCLPIEQNQLLEVAWTKRSLKSSISALLSIKTDTTESTGDVYILKFTHKEGTGFESKGEIPLKLEESNSETALMGSNSRFERALLLSKKECE